MDENILLQEWEGPYQGVPAFDKMTVADIKPAMERAMEINLKEIENIKITITIIMNSWKKNKNYWFNRGCYQMILSKYYNIMIEDIN